MVRPVVSVKTAVSVASAVSELPLDSSSVTVAVDDALLGEAPAVAVAEIPDEYAVDAAADFVADTVAVRSQLRSDSEISLRRARAVPSCRALNGRAAALLALSAFSTGRSNTLGRLNMTDDKNANTLNQAFTNA